MMKKGINNNCQPSPIGVAELEYEIQKLSILNSLSLRLCAFA